MILIIIPLLCFAFVFGLLYQGVSGNLGGPGGVGGVPPIPPGASQKFWTHPLYQRHGLSRPSGDWRHAFLLASIVWGVWVTLITEGLSLFNALQFRWVLGLWLVAALGAGLIFLRTWRRREATWPALPRLDRFLWILSGWSLLIAFILLVIALVAPPNTWDSMTYHMARVMHWVQNRSVEFYPTSNERQLYMPPWAGYAITQFQILSSSDRFANLIQWYSMIGSLVGATLIARQMGANLRGQIFTIVAGVTIPMGILQSTSTQT
ncbi:MAG: hypothetical protein ACE5H9_14495, partial [Anaerolineae bacterium]